MHYYYYWFYFPSKKVRHGRRCWRPLDYLREHFNELDSIEAASSISTVTDNCSSTDSDSSEDEAWFAPRLDTKSSASASAVRRENIMLRRIIRRQDEILEEMRLRTIQIQEATAQRRAELAELRAARARREAAAAADVAAAEAGVPGQESETTTEAVDAQSDQEATTTESDGGEVTKNQEFDNNKKK